jgi:hypothetical protein
VHTQFPRYQLTPEMIVTQGAQALNACPVALLPVEDSAVPYFRKFCAE